MLELATLSKIAAAVGKFLWPRLRRLKAERGAAADPESVSKHMDEFLDEAFQRLGVNHPQHDWWITALKKVENKFISTDLLNSEHVKKWLTQADTQNLFKKRTKAALAGNKSDEKNSSVLISSYVEVTLGSEQEAVSVISTIDAILRAGVQSAIRDTGLAVLVQAGNEEILEATRGLHLKFDLLITASSKDDQTKSDSEIIDEWQQEFKLASENLLTWPTKLHGGGWLNRPELDQLIAALEVKRYSSTVLLAPAGSGKSSFLATLGKILQTTHKLPVLAIKSDLLDREIVTESDLQKHLALSELPSKMLIKLSQQGPVALLIDQLDAIAAYVDLQTGRLNAILNLIRKVGKIDNIHIVLASREFEYEHDVRLKTIDTESLRLTSIAWQQVEETLKARGIAVAGWPDDARKVLSNPQALNIYLSLNPESGSEPFTTYQSMLDALWNKRVNRDEHGNFHSHVAYKIANLMAEEESLWLAESRFDDEAKSIKSLLASGILARSPQGSIGFAHQTIFEYALARHFAKDKSRLASYVLERQDSLFLRPKLWATLNYLRPREENSYNAVFQELWRATKLRKHLRFLLIDFMGQQQSPSNEEILLMAQALSDENLQIPALRAIAGSPGWFATFATGYISSAMIENEATANATVPILFASINFNQDLTIDLINNNWLKEPKNDDRVFRMLSNASHWLPRLESLAKHVINRTPFHYFYLDNILATLGANQPSQAIELLRAILDSQLDRARIEAQELAKAGSPANLINRPSSKLEALLRTNYWDSLPALASDEPKIFIESIWPWVLSVYEELSSYSLSSTALSYKLIGSSDFTDIDKSNSPDNPPLLDAISQAIGKLAKEDREWFKNWKDFAQTCEYCPVHRLISLTLASDPSTHADEALEYLTSDTRRLTVGSLKDTRSITKILVSGCAPFWTKKQTERFESFVTDWEANDFFLSKTATDRRTAQRIFRRIKTTIFAAIPVHNRSAAMTAEIREYERTFDYSKSNPPPALTYDSTMSSEAMSLASDNHILNAFSAADARIANNEEPGLKYHEKIQLSREFADFSKINPFRAKQLLIKLPPQLSGYAAAFTIDALITSGRTTIASEIISSLPGLGYLSDDFKISASNATERLIHESVEINTEHTNTLEHWFNEVCASHTTNDNSEALTENNRSTTSINEGKFGPTKSLLRNEAFNDTLPTVDVTVTSTYIQALISRGEFQQACEAFERYLAHSIDPVAWEYLLPTLNTLQDTDTHDTSLSINVLEQVPGLAGKSATAMLLNTLLRDVPDDVRRQLEKWKAHTSTITRGGFGELVLQIVSARPELTWASDWLDEIYRDDSMISARAGAAISAVDMWNNMSTRLFATEALENLLSRGEHGVWEAVFDLFRIIDVLKPEKHTSKLLNIIAKHIETAPPLDGIFIIPHLSAHMPHDAEALVKIALGLARIWHDKLADPTTSISACSPDLFNLATTLHRTPTTRLEGLELFEAMTEIDARSAQGILDEIDNRFRETPPPMRRRLRTRSQLRAYVQRKGK
ncbi:ATP-binding protein [Pseudomonas hunanensis]|uniref:NACHT domain-containing protein n=1 Tax=Pseudomonas hunanensis TaxID=1247546 RepID=UPI0030DDD8E9